MSASTGMRPLRSVSTPSQEPAGEALTPAPHTMAPAGMKRPPTVAPSGVMLSTACPVSTTTPSSSSLRRAYWPRSSGKVDRMRGPASTSRTRAVRGSMRRKSRANVKRASSATAPAISTPVGPPPTTMVVISAFCRAGSSLISACSKFISSRARIRRAFSMVFRPGAISAQSSCPK